MPRIANIPLPFLLLALLGLGVLVERLIVTDREAVEAVLEEAVSAFEAGDLERLGGLIDETYLAAGRDRARVVAYAETVRRLYRPSQTSVHVQEVTVEGDDAKARLRVWTLVTPGRIPVDLEVRLRRRPQGWRIAGAEVRGFGGAGLAAPDDARQPTRSPGGRRLADAGTDARCWTWRGTEGRS